MTLNFTPESLENPKLMEVFHERAYHQAFCYAVACEDKGNKNRPEKLLMTIISASDSAIQSMKATIDMGTYDALKFGYGEKELTGYKFKPEKSFSSEKGKYERFPMTLNQNRKAVAIVHEDLLNTSKYVLSFEGNPARDIAQLLGGAQYGLHILPEWEKTVLYELQQAGYLIEHELYYDHRLFPDGLFMYSINLNEEEADHFIENLIKQKKIIFPVDGDGSALDEITDLTSYLLQYNDAMVEKLSEQVKPIHNPLINEPLKLFNTYNRELFPVQAHTATANVKRLKKKGSKAVILQGEMSTGKTIMMTAVADGINYVNNRKKGYFACVMCPPSLTSKWPDEIRKLIPAAEVHVIKKTAELIKFHQDWTNAGRLKPKKPVFFVISFTTMRNDAAIQPAVKFERKKTNLQRENALTPYKDGYYCPSCGKPHQMIDSERCYIDENGIEQVEIQSHNMSPKEFGISRRINNGVNPANAFCSHCGESLWSKKVNNRYTSFKEWIEYEQKLMPAIMNHDKGMIAYIQQSQKEHPSSIKMPRRVAAIEYIRRKCKNFFDISIVDEIHELKGGMTAQGNALGSLVAASKKVIAGTGTLFGGKAEDIYYLLWRLFPEDMVRSGYKFEEVTRFNEEYGNIEETTYQPKDDSRENSNKQSRGGHNNTRKKVVPGISPFIYGRYMLQNVVNVRLIDVWPDPVELVDTPTIFVPMGEELKRHYEGMISSIESAIHSKENGHRLYTLLTDYGIAYPDNPFSFPDAMFRNEAGSREVIWEATHLSEEITLPKEKKLQEIIETEISEGRKSIVYVRDTGSSVKKRDVRTRIKQKLEEVGAKVCILDTTTTATNKRSEWLSNKIENEGYDVCIVSQELVKVGLDLLCTPTLIYYQFSWSLFTINQSSRRAWRIGQTQECRIFYLAYEGTYQKQMADLIARKNAATKAINGDVSSDGLSAMLGDTGDLQSMLIQAVKEGGAAMKGSAEDWISQQSDRSRELLANIGKKINPKKDEAKETVVKIIESQLPKPTSIVIENPILLQENNEKENIKIQSVAELKKSSSTKKSKRRAAISSNQLEFDLFG